MQRLNLWPNLSVLKYMTLIFVHLVSFATCQNNLNDWSEARIFSYSSTFPVRSDFLGRSNQFMHVCVTCFSFFAFFSRRIIVTTWFDCATVLRIEQQTTWFRQNRRPICFSELVAEKPGDQKSYMNFTSSETLDNSKRSSEFFERSHPSFCSLGKNLPRFGAYLRMFSLSQSVNSYSAVGSAKRE